MWTLLRGHYAAYNRGEGRSLNVTRVVSLTLSLPTCKEYWGHRRMHVCDRIHFIVAIEIGNGYANFQDLSLGLAMTVMLI